MRGHTYARAVFIGLREEGGGRGGHVSEVFRPQEGVECWEGFVWREKKSKSHVLKLGTGLGLGLGLGTPVCAIADD